MSERAVSLFSGCGGLDLGLERAGFEHTRFCESDAACRRVLEERWPGVEIVPDVRELQHDGKPVTLLAGGFPCQDLSYAGKGAGLDGERSGLYFEMARAVRLLRPANVLVENVPGLATRGLGRVLYDLAEAGYVGSWLRLRAADIGAPHRRDRIFIVARDATADASVGGRRPRPGLRPSAREAGERERGRRPRHDDCEAAPDTGGEPGEPGRRRRAARGADTRARTTQHDRHRHARQAEPGTTEADADADSGGRTRLAQPDGDEEAGLEAPRRRNDRRRRAAAPDTGDARREGPAHDRARGRDRPGERAEASADTVRRGRGGRENVEGVGATGRTGPRGHAEAAADSDGVGRREGGPEPAVRDGQPDVIERAEWGCYADAIERWERIRGDRAPRPTDDRGRLAPDFVEWMLGYPIGWTEVADVSRTARLRMLGNSVQVQLGELVGTAIRSAA